jgi:hypothetical protein
MNASETKTTDAPTIDGTAAERSNASGNPATSRGDSCGAGGETAGGWADHGKQDSGVCDDGRRI